MAAVYAHGVSSSHFPLLHIDVIGDVLHCLYDVHVFQCCTVPQAGEVHELHPSPAFAYVHGSLSHFPSIHIDVITVELQLSYDVHVFPSSTSPLGHPSHESFLIHTSHTFLYQSLQYQPHGSASACALVANNFTLVLSVNHVGLFAFAPGRAFSGSPAHLKVHIGLSHEIFGIIEAWHCIWAPSFVWHVQWSSPLLSIKNAPSHSTNSHFKFWQEPEYEIFPPSQFFVAIVPHPGFTFVSHTELQFPAPNNELHLLPLQLQKHAWPHVLTTLSTPFVLSPHSKVSLFDSSTTNDPHIVSCANLWALFVFTTIPWSPITANTLLLPTLLELPSLHKNELSQLTVAFTHIATELIVLALLLLPIVNAFSPAAVLLLPHTTVEYLPFDVFLYHHATVP